MKVLVTGANGFIGRHCIAPLLRHGYEVCAVSRARRRSSDVEWHQADILNAGEMRTLLASVRPTHLLHMAWITAPGVYWTSPENLRWLTASVQLLEEFVGQGGSRVVTAGTCAEYEWDSGVCSEAMTPLKPGTLYGACKHALQDVIAAFARQGGVTAAWGRIFFTYGPHEHPARLVPSVVGRLMFGMPVLCTEGKQRRDFLFVEDVAEAFVALLRSDVSGAVNIASGVPVSVYDVVSQIAAEMQGEGLVKFGARASPPGDPDLLVGDITRLRDEVRWAPQYSLASGLARTIEWWQEQFASGGVLPDLFC